MTRFHHPRPVPRAARLLVITMLVVSACSGASPATTESTAEVAASTAQQVVDLVASSPTIDLAGGSLSSFPYERLADEAGMDVEELRTGLEDLYADLSPQVRRPGFGRGAGVGGALPRFVNPLAVVGSYGADQGVERIRQQKDPADEETVIEPRTKTQKLTTATGSIEMVIDIGGTIIRVQGASWTISSSATVTSSITGENPVTVVENIQLSIKATSCPDASGRAPFEVGLTVDSVLTGGKGSGGTSRLTSTTTGTAIANDNADLAATDWTMSVQRTFTDPDKPPTSVDFGLGFMTGKGAPAAPANSRMSWEGLDAKAASALAVWSSIQAVSAASSVDSAMASAWQSGLCVAARFDGATADARRQVPKDAEVSVVVLAEHRIDGGDLPLPIEATLDGVFLINPSGQRLPAPATFTYTAGSAPLEYGKVTAQVISRRGKSKPVSTGFEVVSGYQVSASDFSGAYSIEGEVCDEATPFRLTWQGSDAVAGIQGTMDMVPDPATGVGNWTFSGTLAGSLPVTGSGQYSLDLPKETILLTSQNFSIVAPIVGPQPLGPGGQHLGRLDEPIRMLANADVTCP